MKCNFYVLFNEFVLLCVALVVEYFLLFHVFPKTISVTNVFVFFLYTIFLIMCMIMDSLCIVVSFVTVECCNSAPGTCL